MSVRQFDSPLRFMVQSEYDDEVEYLVDLGEGDGGVCSCWRSWNFRERCKHILLVRGQFCDEMIDRVKKSDLNEPVMDIKECLTLSPDEDHLTSHLTYHDSSSLKSSLLLREEEERYKEDQRARAKGLGSTLAEIKTIFPEVDIDAEVKKMRAWLCRPENRKRQLTPKFMTNWILHANSPALLNGKDLPENDRKILEMDPLTMDEETKHRWIMLDHAQRHGK